MEGVVSGESPRDRAWIVALWRAQPGLRDGYVMDVAFPLLLGIVTLVGGWQRVSGNGWVTMRQYGGPYLWGALLILTALVLLAVAFASTHRAFVWALRGAAVVYGLAAVWFFNAAAAIDTVSFWGCLTCLYICATHIMRANHYRAVAL